MGAFKRKELAWLFAKVCCVTMGATGCNRAVTASQTPVASSGLSAVTSAATVTPSAVGSTPQARLGGTGVSDPQAPPRDLQTSCVIFSGCRYDTEKSQCRSRTQAEPAAPAHANPGPSCECNSGRCALIQIPEVPCKTDQDCWISDEFPHRPIARPAKLRGRKFKPCVDGEVSPMCQGVCGYDPRVWKC